MSFNPNEHLMKVSGKQYLPAAARIAWFRDTYPNGAIVSEAVQFDPFPIFKTTVTNNDGVVIAVDYGSAMPKPGAVWAGREVEKASTASIARALALAGFGTLFSLEYDDTDALSDSPVEKKPKAPVSQGKIKSGANRPTFGDNPKMLKALMDFAAGLDLDEFEVLTAMHFNSMADFSPLPCDEPGREVIKTTLTNYRLNTPHPLDDIVDR